MKSRVLCRSNSVHLCMCGALESKSRQQLDYVWQQLFEQQDITYQICTIHFHPW